MTETPTTLLSNLSLHDALPICSTHPLYGKVVRSNRKVKAHDEKNEAHVGDFVSIMETRPLSKTKRWRLDSIVERAK